MMMRERIRPEVSLGFPDSQSGKSPAWPVAGEREIPRRTLQGPRCRVSWAGWPSKQPSRIVPQQPSKTQREGESDDSPITSSIVHHDSRLAWSCRTDTAVSLRPRRPRKAPVSHSIRQA